MSHPGMAAERPLKRIAILLHQCQHPRSHNYLIDALAETWREQGMRVEYISGLRHRPQTDLLFPHIDLTRIPLRYQEFIGTFPAAVSREGKDINKRSYSANLLRREDDYQGPVIVKTDNNCGGYTDYYCRKFQHPLRAPLAKGLGLLAERALGRHFAWRQTLRQYPVYDSLAQVPAGVFANPALVVERFRPEREGERYFIRHYLFLGDKYRSTRVAGKTPFLKRQHCEAVEEGLPVPPEVAVLRRQLGLDYGKIDYTLSDGEVTILDVNRATGAPGTPEATARAAADLAEGIYTFLPKAQG
jgi:hypothetical protein